MQINKIHALYLTFFAFSICKSGLSSTSAADSLNIIPQQQRENECFDITDENIAHLRDQIKSLRETNRKTVELYKGPRYLNARAKRFASLLTSSSIPNILIVEGFKEVRRELQNFKEQTKNTTVL